MWDDPLSLGAKDYSDGEGYYEDEEGEEVGEEEGEEDEYEDVHVDDEDGEYSPSGAGVLGMARHAEDDDTMDWLPETNTLSQNTSRVSYRSRTIAVGALLRFMYLSATEEFINGASSTLLVYFATVRGLASPSGHRFLYPSQFTPILARLVYCIRLTS